MSPSPIQILMVEDNDGDIFLTMEAFKAAKLANNVSIVRDGVEAMDYLHRIDKFASAHRPDLILLDLNLPRRDGRQVLAEIKSDPNLRTIPVVILTSSKAEEDVVKAYDMAANCYITKPVDFASLMQVVAAIESFWFTVVRLPSSAQ